MYNTYLELKYIFGLDFRIIHIFKEYFEIGMKYCFVCIKILVVIVTTY